MLPLQVTAREVMNICLEITAIWGCITQLPGVVGQKSGGLQNKVIIILAVACDATDSSGWCAAKFLQLISCAARHKRLATTGLRCALFKASSFMSITNCTEET